MPINAQQMNHLPREEAEKIKKSIRRNPVYLILENIYDTYNVSGFFRLAEVLAAEKVYLCGTTQTPSNTKIKRASMGSYQLVPWEYKDDAAKLIKSLKKYDNVQVVEIEQNERSIDYRSADHSFPIAFIFGNETYGVKSETVELADTVIEIPMYGVNKSLNAMVAAGIATYWVLNKKNEESDNF